MESDLLAKKIEKTALKRVDFLAMLRGDYDKEDDQELQALEEKLTQREKESAVEEKAKPKDDYFEIVKCDNCGTKTKINFKPDPTRPILCKDCLAEYRRQQSQTENSNKRSAGISQMIGAKKQYSAPRHDYSAPRPASRPQSNNSFSVKEAQDVVYEPTSSFSLNSLKDQKPTKF